MELKERVDYYLKKARPLFDGLKDTQPKETDLKKIQKRFRQMAFDYYSDAIHFYEKGEYARALAALEYAEGWMDAGCELGVFKKP
jgi:hypothetical protein